MCWTEPTHEFLLAKLFVKEDDLGEQIQPERLAYIDSRQTPTMSGTKTCPMVHGATNWYSTAFDPHTHLFYLMAPRTVASIARAGRIWDKILTPAIRNLVTCGPST